MEFLRILCGNRINYLTLLFLSSIIFVLVSYDKLGVACTNPSTSGDPGVPLFLTPFIKAGKIEDARNLSLVSNLTDVISYSGFITVNSTYNSNLFFWFFPAAYNPKTAPLLIWLQGGPGGSSLFGLFIEMGPFIVDSNNNIQFRNTAWTLTHSVVFIDNPVGSGFSFTDSDKGYARNEVDVGQNLYNFMVQFYQLFPEYKTNELYITGESYAGKYVPALAYKIHKENQLLLNKTFQIPLVGLAMGDAVTDFVSIVGWSEVLYGVGLLDDNQLKIFQDQENMVKEYIRQEKWIDAFEIIDSLIFDQSTSYMRNVTGLNYHYNYMLTEEPVDYKYYVSFLQQNYIRRSLHVGNLSFNDSSSVVGYYLREDIPQSVKPWVEELLNSTKYRILYYTGQLDVIVSHRLSLAQLNSFNWIGSKEFKSSERKIWRIGGNNCNGDIGGYIKETPYLSYLLVRNAGHILPYDQPKWAFDMINRFTSKKPFATSS